MPSSPAIRPDGPRRVGRPSGPTAQGAASRDAIVDTAAGVFARLGYERARMADIVTASGLSKGSVYFHFDSKESLAMAVLQSRQERWIADVSARVSAAAPGKPRIRALMPAMLGLHAADPDAWVISRLSHNLAELESTREFAADMLGQWIDVVAGIMREAVLVSGIESVGAEPGHVATVAVGAFDGLKMTVDVVTRGDREAAQRALTEGGALIERMVLDALGFA